jgi:adenylosuccinate lyase
MKAIKIVFCIIGMAIIAISCKKIDEDIIDYSVIYIKKDTTQKQTIGSSDLVLQNLTSKK